MSTGRDREAESRSAVSHFMHQHDVMSTRGESRPGENQNSVAFLQITGLQTPVDNEMNQLAIFVGRGIRNRDDSPVQAHAP